MPTQRPYRARQPARALQAVALLVGIGAVSTVAGALGAHAPRSASAPVIQMEPVTITAERVTKG